jgi:hypothetical protein
MNKVIIRLKAQGSRLKAQGSRLKHGFSYSAYQPEKLNKGEK